jgi:hypothetical protein
VVISLGNVGAINIIYFTKRGLQAQEDEEENDENDDDDDDDC